MNITINPLLTTVNKGEGEAAVAERVGIAAEEKA